MDQNQSPMKENIPQPIPQPESPRLLSMRSQFNFFGIATAIYALFFTFCLYKNYAGITFPFFVSGTLYYFYLCMKKLSIPLKKDAAFYIVSIVLLGIATFLTDDGSIIFMNYIAVFTLFISFLLHHFYEDGKWNFSNSCFVFIASVFGSITCIGNPISDFSKYRKEKGKDVKQKNTILYVILGALAAVPLLFLVLVLLASADVVFSDILGKLLDKIFQGDHILGCIFMFIMAFFLAYAFIAFLCKTDHWDDPQDKRTGEPVLAITFTTILSIVYIVFSIIQIVYLFFGQMELPSGYTYAEYARQGFFQLLFVCIINLIMVLICMYRFKESKVLKVILTIISLCTYIMIASSALRMIIYIKFYYLTFLRVFVLWSLAVIFLLMTGVLVTVYKNKFPLFRYSMIIVTVLYITLSFSHPDYWIAKCNVANLTNYGKSEFFEQRGGYKDMYYLFTLSMDAAPVLLDMSNYNEEMHKDMLVENYIEKAEEKTENLNLRNFNVSRYIAKLML